MRASGLHDVPESGAAQEPERRVVQGPRVAQQRFMAQTTRQPTPQPRDDGGNGRQSRGATMAGQQAKSEIRRAERMVEACDLRRSGASYRTIASALGIDVRTAWGLVHDALDELNKQAVESLEMHRRVQMARLDRMLEAVWPLVEAGEIQAIESARKIEADRRKFLGLDAPEHQIHEVATVSPEEAARLVRESFGEHATPRPGAEAEADGDGGS